MPFDILIIQKYSCSKNWLKYLDTVLPLIKVSIPSFVYCIFL